ncbi:hypothetical protein [Ruegeria arenilitoris]|uniref:hypothetical protein n=1 Tax=Ruegeria arenilitoris TaxID=1173585 RepID=UPI00147D49E5|nr:hypothetical protein [Ruegeria arenilitoris]
MEMDENSSVPIFWNGRECAKNFSNAEVSKLTSGGSYVTAETRTSFKGYYSQSSKTQPFYRTFLLFDGEGETSNARESAIGVLPDKCEPVSVRTG